MTALTSETALSSNHSADFPPLVPFQYEDLLRLALLEDLAQGDVTTDAVFQPSARIAAKIVAREPLVASGLAVAATVFSWLDATVEIQFQACEGDVISPGQALMTVQGSTAAILKAERTALNFLQRLCGIATTTRRFVTQLDGSGVRITDTRKTTPGWRILEKHAVLAGGGSPHRFNLGSAVLLKDNHIKAAGGIQSAVAKIRQRLSHTMTIEVEVETLSQLAEALAAKVSIVLLDNMTPEQVREAVAVVNGQAIVEVSGGVRQETLRDYAIPGVQYISTSQITLGASPVDIALDV